jgi:hypothetical protein
MIKIQINKSQKRKKDSLANKRGKKKDPLGGVLRKHSSGWCMNFLLGLIAVLYNQEETEKEPELADELHHIPARFSSPEEPAREVCIHPQLPQLNTD